MNYTYDEIIASAYYVFKNDLTTRIVSLGLTNLIKYGVKIKRYDLKLNQLKDIIEFKDCKYVLKEGYTIQSIEKFTKAILVTLFEEIQRERDKEYEERCSGKSYIKVR